MKLVNCPYLKGVIENQDIILKQAYQKLKPMIAKVYREKGIRPDQFDDLYQDSFISTVAFVQKKKSSLTAKFSTIFHQIATNQANSFLRKKRIIVYTSDNTNSDTIDIEYDPSEEVKFDLLHSTFNELGVKCQEILKLFYWSKLNLTDIAKQLGYSNAASAANQKSRCISKMKEKVSNYEFSEK